jgi:cytoskeletal protein CcmA (bactofilin family)
MPVSSGAAGLAAAVAIIVTTWKGELVSDVPRRRLLDRFNTPPTVVGRKSRFVGDIVNPGPLVLCGAIEGDGQVDGMLSITREASWTGNVRALEAIIAGQLTGNLTVRGKLEIGAKAVILGRITAGSIAIARGAVVEGEMLVTGAAPIVQFDEKREPADEP